MFDEYGPVDDDGSLDDGSLDDGSLDDGSLDDGSLVDELFDHLTRHFTHSEVEDEQGHFDHFDHFVEATHDELTYDEVDAVRLRYRTAFNRYVTGLLS